MERDEGTSLPVPDALERSEIPRYFRQFRDAGVLKKLAHSGKGPRYQIIGRSAWYDTADIRAWLESRKASGPRRGTSAPPLPISATMARSEKRRRGRPTKAEQRRRQIERQAAADLAR